MTGRVCTCPIDRWPPEFWLDASGPRCLDSDRTPSPTNTNIRNLPTLHTQIHVWKRMSPGVWCSDTHHSVGLLRLQVFFIHLVEFVKDGRHNRKTALLPPLQNWEQHMKFSLCLCVLLYCCYITLIFHCVLIQAVFRSDFCHFLTLQITWRRVSKHLGHTTSFLLYLISFPHRASLPHTVYQTYHLSI